MPVMDTSEATTREHTRNIQERNSRTRRPIAAASSSPIIIMLNRVPIRVNTTVPVTTKIAGMVSVFH